MLDQPAWTGPPPPQRFARLADLGAIFDPELRRRCERLAGSLEVA